MSDFEKAFESPYGKKVGSSLLTQYRMAQPIGDLVSSSFYEGRLETGERIIPDFYNKSFDFMRSTVTWCDTSHRGNKAMDRPDGLSFTNPEEAEQILFMLKQIEANPSLCSELNELVKDGEAAIGVICMYAAQKRLLRKKFNALNWKEGFKDLIKIDTVDSYQGKENRIIILSVTRNSKDRKPRFLRHPNRINVAMSRAMDRLIIVGSIEMWNKENRLLPLGVVAQYIQERQGKDYQIIKANRDNKHQGGKK